MYNAAFPERLLTDESSEPSRQVNAVSLVLLMGEAPGGRDLPDRKAGTQVAVGMGLREHWAAFTRMFT